MSPAEVAWCARDQVLRAAWTRRQVTREHLAEVAPPAGADRAFTAVLPPETASRVPAEAKASVLASADQLLRGEWEVLGVVRTDMVQPDWFRDPLTGRRSDPNRYAFRVDHLREVGAAVRFVSAEPLLGPVPSLNLSGIHWVIAGGESGKAARPMHPTWARRLRDACQDGEVAFFFKQWGTWAPAPPEAKLSVTVEGELVQSDMLVGVPGAPAPVRRSSKAAAGRLLDGRTWDQMPARAGHTR